MTKTNPCSARGAAPRWWLWRLIGYYRGRPAVAWATHTMKRAELLQPRTPCRGRAGDCNARDVGLSAHALIGVHMVRRRGAPVLPSAGSPVRRRVFFWVCQCY